MRITNSILQREAITTLQRNSAALEQAQSQVSTGLKLQTASDDPVAAAGVMRASGGLRALTQYRRNIGGARARLSTEESVLDQVGDLLTRAKELAIGQAGDTANAQTRLTAKAEVDQLAQQLVQLGNTQVNGAYLFGGDTAQTAPFKSDGTPATLATIGGGTLATSGAAPAPGNQVAISAGRWIATNHDGAAVFLKPGTMTAVNALSSALGANDPAAIASAIGQLDTAFDGTQDLLGEVGARTNQLDIASSNIDAFETTLTSTKSDLSEADVEASVTTLVSRQTAYQAALAATSRIMSTSLTDYLR